MARPSAETVGPIFLGFVMPRMKAPTRSIDGGGDAHKWLVFACRLSDADFGAQNTLAAQSGSATIIRCLSNLARGGSSPDQTRHVALPQTLVQDEPFRDSASDPIRPPAKNRRSDAQQPAAFRDLCSKAAIPVPAEPDMANSSTVWITKTTLSCSREHS
jgi:hypothetical protein